MATLFHVELITVERHLLSADVAHVRVPGSGGDFGVLAHHAPLAAGLRPGRLTIDFPDHSEDFAVGGGYFTVENNRAVILAETCLRKSEIDLDRAQRARTYAQEKFDNAETQAERDEARQMLLRAQARIMVAELRPE